MFTIEYCDVIDDNISVGSLFEQIGFSQYVPQTDESGDSFIANEWPIEILSVDGYYPIEGFRWTKPEDQVVLFHVNLHGDGDPISIKQLQCSPDHVVMCKSGLFHGWTKVRDLVPGDLIVTRHGLRSVTQIVPFNDRERLCDVQVSIAHSYFTDDVLSHNSHFLTFLGAHALRNNVDVLHYTMELSEAAVGRRYDSNLCEIDSNDVIEGKDNIIEKYNSMKLGRLMIKEFPTNTATIYTLRSHIERLDLKGFRPGLIIIDYADIMRSTRQYDSLRHELKLIYEELRGFAGEKLLPVWTASQANKEGSTTDIVDLGNMSEAYGKAMVADVVLSISRKSHEKASGWGRLFIAKNRAGRDGIVYPIRIDTARSKFEVSGGPGNLEEAKQDDERLTKRALRLKWEELRNEPVLQRQDDTSNAEPR